MSTNPYGFYGIDQEVIEKSMSKARRERSKAGPRLDEDGADRGSSRVEPQAADIDAFVREPIANQPAGCVRAGRRRSSPAAGCRRPACTAGSRRTRCLRRCVASVAPRAAAP